MRAYINRRIHEQTPFGVFHNVGTDEDIGSIIVHAGLVVIEVYWTRHETPPTSVGDRGVW